MTEQKIWFESSKGTKLCGLINLHEDSESKPTIILVHGMMPQTDKHEYGFFDFVAPELYKKGYNTFRFDFFAHGESDGDYKDVTVSQEVDDLKLAIDLIFSKDIDSTRVGILSTSFGAASSVLLADKRIKCFELTCPAVRMDKHDMYVFNKHLGPDWRKEFDENGFATIKVELPKEDRKRKIGAKFWEGICSIDWLEEIKDINVPVFILAAGSDRYVKTEDVKLLFGAANEPKFLKIVEGADHGIASNDKEIKIFMEETQQFFGRWLR